METLLNPPQVIHLTSALACLNLFSLYLFTGTENILSVKSFTFTRITEAADLHSVQLSTKQEQTLNPIPSSCHYYRSIEFSH